MPNIAIFSVHTILQSALEDFVVRFGYKVCFPGEAEVGLYDLNGCPSPPRPPPFPTLALVAGEDCHALDVLRLGYKGYLPSGSTLEQFERALAAVRRGEIWAERRVLAQAFDLKPTLQPLTQREKDVLTRVIRGLSNQEIATEMRLSLNTVKGYVSRLYDKLEVRNRTELVLSQKPYL